MAEYRYDAAGRRVLKVVTNSGDLNGTTRYLWGGQSDWQCLEELDGGDDIVARYTYAPGYIDAVACQERDLTGDGDFADTDEVVYYHSSTLYSVYALSDSNESVVERYRYDAYGEASVLDADHSSDADGASDAGNPYLYTGRRLDAESGLMQYRHRYYSGGLGRFVSRDPAGYVDGYCLYEYVNGRPVLLWDPMGLGFWGDVWAGAKIVGRRTARGARRVGRAAGRKARAIGSGTVAAGKSVGRSAASVGQTYGKLLGVTDMSWDDIYDNTPLGQAQGTWAETPTKVAHGIAAGATVAAGGLIALEAGGVTAIGSAPLSTLPASITGTTATITGATTHGAQRMMQRGISMDTARRVVKCATKVARRVDAQGRVSVRYTYKQVTVVLNEAGEIITAWGPPD